MRRTLSSVGRISIAAVCAAATALVGTPSGDAQPTFTTVISSLNAPRGITFDGKGTMYVAQSGLAGNGPAGLTTTGAVSGYRWGSSTPAWTTNFQSLYVTEDPSGPPDVLGPAGLSAVGNGCMKNSSGRRNGCKLEVILGESHDGVAAASGGAITNADQAGHLFRLDGASGRATDLADVGDQDYQWTSDRRGLFSDFPDANPYGVLVTRGGRGGTRTFIADAGANTVEEVMPGGAVRVIAYLPNETAPPFRDATPTCIAQGPDGMLYVATLHLVANFISPGRSDVWRVNPNANYPTAPQLWASGLTTPTACTFDRSGNFWATEMFAPSANSAPGDIVRIPFAAPTQQTHIGLGSLPLPGGIAQGPDGAMYVTVNAASPVPGSGAVVRVSG